MNRSGEAEVKDFASFGRAGVLTKKEVFRWNIPTLLAKRGEARSDVFTFGAARNWKFCLMLTMDPEKSEFLYNHFGVCLQRIPMNSASEEIAIKVSFALLDTRDRLHYACEKIMRDADKIYATFDSNIFDKHQQIFIQKDVLSLHCAMDVGEVLSDDAQDVIDAKRVRPCCDDCNGVKELVTGLKSLLEQEKFCDFSLCVGDKEFKVHRSILAARSPVFAAMFEHDTREKMENRVTIEDVDSDVVSQLLRYVYTGDTDQLTPSLSISLLAAADKYALPNLKKKCSYYLSSNLTADKALGVLTVANLHEDETLKDAAIQIILDNAIEVINTEDWLTFLREYSELANSIILRLAMRR